MSRMLTLNSPFLLGFDAVERALDRMSKAASDGYPPYNIERLAHSETAPERLRITPSPLHSDDDISHLLNALSDLWSQCALARAVA